ncbi:hypothetical protein [Azospirillum argentinense]|uniref:Uncharacterized protein n=1 Tax=Azospirillum argentinense TaxID=2970906 RepID=A0A5B0KXA8_9PROT|nr:hypothetical protein FH063_001525 [Azospirillum argentinense]
MSRQLLRERRGRHTRKNSAGRETSPPRRLSLFHIFFRDVNGRSGFGG